MKNHDWRNNHFHLGKWEGRETCLMEWCCFACGETKTIPDSQEKPEGGECYARIDLQKLQCVRERHNTEKYHKNKSSSLPQKSKFGKQPSR